MVHLVKGPGRQPEGEAAQGIFIQPGRTGCKRPPLKSHSRLPIDGQHQSSKARDLLQLLQRPPAGEACLRSPPDTPAAGRKPSPYARKYAAPGPSASFVIGAYPVLIHVIHHCIPDGVHLRRQKYRIADRLPPGVSLPGKSLPTARPFPGATGYWLYFDSGKSRELVKSGLLQGLPPRRFRAWRTCPPSDGTPPGSPCAERHSHRKACSGAGPVYPVRETSRIL